MNATGDPGRAASVGDNGPMHSSTRRGALALVFTCLALSAPGCKERKAAVEAKAPSAKAALPAFFQNPEQTKPRLLALVKIPSLNKSLATVGAVANKLELPLEAATLRQAALAPLALPEDVWARVDGSRQVVFAMLAGEKGAAATTAIAGWARSAKDAEALVAILGNKVGEDAGTLHIQRPDGRSMWLFLKGAQMVASETLEGLKTAGAHAWAVHGVAKEDVLAALFPEAMARAEGTTLREAVDKARAQFMDLVALQAAQPGATPSPFPPEVMEKMLAAFADPFLDQLVETAAVTLALVVDEADGLLLRGRVHPVEGSAFAKTLAQGKPASLAPAFAQGALPAGLFAATYSAETLDRYAQAMAALAKVDAPGMKELAEASEQLMKALGGGYSGSFSFENGLGYSFVATLAEGANPETVMNALDRALGPSGLGALMKAANKADKGARRRGKPGPTLAWKRQGLTGKLEVPLLLAEMPAAERQRIRQVFGSDKVTYTFAIVNDRLLGIVHPRPEEEIARLTQDTQAKPSPAMAQVLEETRGAEGFVYIDLMGLVRPVLQASAQGNPEMAQANAMMAMLPGLQALSVPMIMSYAGGEALTANLALPLRTFENLATALRPLFGMFKAAEPPPAAPPAP